MKTIRVKLASNAYPVYLGQGLLHDHEIWQEHLSAGKTLIVSNDVVAPLYLDSIKSALRNKEHDVLIIPDGEPHKNTRTWNAIIDKLVSIQARRDSNLIALGGGVVGDLTGFAAASYMRGIRFVQAPTTLLAQVDASVGGKTGINHEKGKNLIGAFHQPVAVVIDSSTLDTLEEREYNAGLAEVVKYGAIADSEFFDWMESSASRIIRRERAAIEHLIQRSVANKASIVAEDEKEAGIRAILNFGHSFGHALEAETRYAEFLHGEAVSIGMVVAARLSESVGLCAAGTRARLEAMLKRFSLPVKIPANISIQMLVEALDLDKKAVAAGLRLILLNAIGKAEIKNYSDPQHIVRAMQQSQCRETTGNKE